MPLFDGCQAVQEKALSRPAASNVFSQRPQQLDVVDGLGSSAVSFTSADQSPTRLPSIFQGKDAEADSLFERAIGIGDTALGPDHPNLVMWLNNRAFVLMKQVRGIVINHRKRSLQTCMLDRFRVR